MGYFCTESLSLIKYELVRFKHDSQGIVMVSEISRSISLADKPGAVLLRGQLRHCREGYLFSESLLTRVVVRLSISMIASPEPCEIAESFFSPQQLFLSVLLAITTSH